jgi:O-antigen ligase
MSPQTALAACFLAIVWLAGSDMKRRGGGSSALWIVVMWLIILGTRPVSTWLGQDALMETTDDYVEGSPIDRNVFILLMVAGLVVLARRRINWAAIRANNKWVVLFFLYFALSALWSDYTFVSIKRWVKDFGNIVMVLLVLTDKNPTRAIRTLLARCSYVLIPLSVVFIKYFPELGRSYDRWTGKPFYQGATLGKNTLGGAVAILTLFLVWDLLQVCKSRRDDRSKIEIGNRVVVLLMSIWLLIQADSASSIACAVLGSCGIIVMSLPAMKRRLQYLEIYCLVGFGVLALLSTALDLGTGGLRLLGRDSTLTGRTEIWHAVLAEGSNPLIGAGFYSFWLGSRADRLWENYAFRLNQAHNGYIEIYLNGGLIGLCLLVAMLASAGRTIRRQLLIDTEWGIARLILWLTVLVHNWTEASFSRLSILWFILLLVIVEYPAGRRNAPMPGYGSQPKKSRILEKTVPASDSISRSRNQTEQRSNPI